MSVSDIQLFQILRNKLGDKEAEELVTFIKSAVKIEFDNKKEILATKEDLVNVHKSIYVVGLVQFIAIIASVIVIINFMIK